MLYFEPIMALMCNSTRALTYFLSRYNQKIYQTKEIHITFNPQFKRQCVFIIFLYPCYVIVIVNVVILVKQPVTSVIGCFRFK